MTDKAVRSLKHRRISSILKKWPGCWGIISHPCPSFEVVKETINVIFKNVLCFHETYDWFFLWMIIDSILQPGRLQILSCLEILSFVCLQILFLKLECYKVFRLSDFHSLKIHVQKQPSKGALRKRCSGNMEQIYRIKPMIKCAL